MATKIAVTFKVSCMTRLYVSTKNSNKFKVVITLVSDKHKQIGLSYVLNLCYRECCKSRKAPITYRHSCARNLVVHIIFIDFVNKFPGPVGLKLS
jgi:hypothetical protein